MKISTPSTLLAAALAVSAFTVVGCDVDADSGALPEVSVEGGAMPAVDVEMADIETETVEMEVPVLDMPEEGDTKAGQSEAKQEIEEETGM